MSGVAVLDLTCGQRQPAQQQTGERHVHVRAQQSIIHDAHGRGWIALCCGMHAHGSDYMREPHSRRQALPANVADRKNQFRSDLLNNHKVTGDMMNREDFAGDFVRPAQKMAGPAEFSLYLGSLEESASQMIMLLPQLAELLLYILAASKNLGRRAMVGAVPLNTTVVPALATMMPSNCHNALQGSLRLLNQPTNL